MSSNPSREIFLKNRTTAQQIAQKSRDINADILAKLKLRLPDKALVEDRKDRNNFLLSSGDFQLSKLETSKVIVTGLGDCRIVTPVVVESEFAMFNNIAFTGTKDYLLRIRDGANVLFNGCTFERAGVAPASNDPNSEKCFVLVNDGGKATFIGCGFLGGPSFVGYVVINEGPVANVVVNSCINLTGVPV